MKQFLCASMLVACVSTSLFAGKLAENRTVPYLGGYQDKKEAECFYELSDHVGSKTKGSDDSPVGCKEVHVTNLDDNKKKPKEGSLRWALNKVTGPRKIVFDVEGIIFLDDDLGLQNKTKEIKEYQRGKCDHEDMNNYVTIDGSSAPGKGITITGNTFYLRNVHDVVVQHMRFRVGDDVIRGKNEYKGRATKVEDAVNFEASKEILFKNCSVSWSIDESLSGKYSNNVTIDSCIIAMPLNDPDLHHEGNPSGHAFGSLIGCHNTFIYRSLYAHTRQRSPKVGAAEFPEGAARAAVANCVIYNYGNMGSQMTGKQVAIDHQWECNYYKRRDNQEKPEKPSEITVWHDFKKDSRIYINGNIGPNNPDGGNDWDMIAQKADYKSVEEVQKKHASSKRLFDYPAKCKIKPAQKAYKKVLKKAGAQPRDCIDDMVVETVKKGVGIDPKNKKGGERLDSMHDVGGFDCLRK